MGHRGKMVSGAVEGGKSFRSTPPPEGPGNVPGAHPYRPRRRPDEGPDLMPDTFLVPHETIFRIVSSQARVSKDIAEGDKPGETGGPQRKNEGGHSPAGRRPMPQRDSTEGPEAAVKEGRKTAQETVEGAG